jgi:hypothetical protein
MTSLHTTQRLYSVCFDLDDGGNGDSEHATYAEAVKAFNEAKRRSDCRAVELWEEPEDGCVKKLKEWERED